MSKRKKSDSPEIEAPAGNDAFDALLTEELADPELAASWGETDAPAEAPEPEPEAAPKPVAEPIAEEPAALEAEAPAGDEDEEQPEPMTIEALTKRVADAEREANGLRREVFRRRERERLRREADAAALLEQENAKIAAAQTEGIPFEQTQDGRLVLSPEALQSHIAREIAKQNAPAQPTPNDAYQAMRGRLLSEFAETERSAVEAAAAKLEESYAWLDQQVAEECKAIGIEPAAIGGMDGILRLLDETGLSDEFEARYPGIPIADIIIAPQNERRARKLVRTFLAAGATGEEGDEIEEAAPRQSARSVPQPLGTRPRPPAMGHRGRNRAPRDGSTLVDIHPDQLFEMSDSEFQAAEERSIRKMQSR